MPKVDAHDLIPYAPSGGRPENESSFATTKSPAAVATRAATETTEDNTALKVCTLYSHCEKVQKYKKAK